MTILIRAAHGAIAALFGFAVTSANAQSSWRPERSVEFIVPAAPGGLNDTTMRNMQRVMQALKLVEVPITINNKGGGGGALAWNTLAQHPGDSHFLSLTTVNMLANHIMGVGTAHYRDFTPLGHLIHSYLGFAVKADSPITSGRELLARLKQDPGSMSISIGTSPGNANHVALLQATRSAGVESRRLKTVVFKSNGEALTALLGGHVDAAVSGLPNLAKHVEAGTLRLVALTAPTRLPGILADVPTWREQGADVTVSGWRGLLGPAKMPPAQIAFWEATVLKLVDSAEWEQVLAKDFATRTRMNAAENREFLDQEYKKYQAVLTELGMAKAK
jgi:putative tricarboxylic transport membrane protein